ncbi:MAG: HAD-IC family P-type ATPase, partial [Acetivibrio ethanolgignens]
MDNYFNQEREQLYQKLRAGEQGLSREEAEKRLQRYGANKLREGKKKGVVQVFLEQFFDLLVAILIVAAFISMLSGNIESTMVIFAVILLNAILGTVQHIKAEKSLDSLKALSSPSAKVIRDGEKLELPSEQVVPGDILLLEAGDLVAADGRILKNYSLQVNESSLTGESANVEKT